MSVVSPLGYGIHQIELVPIDDTYATTGYLILGKEQNAIVETGASASNAAILAGLRELNVSTEEIHAIVVTHVHLDHAGGAGTLAEQCPNATVYVHERGMPHLADPEKLIAASRAVYGKSFDRLFHSVKPIPKKRIRALRDGDQLDLGERRLLRFIDTPGHALHHISIVDEESGGIFSGDAAGMYYPELNRKFGIQVALPATTPTQFDPADTLSTLNKMSDLKPRRLYYTHIGMGEPAIPLLDEVKSWLELYGEKCVEIYRKNPSLKLLTNFLHEAVAKRLEKRGAVGDCESLRNMEIHNELNALGLVAYDNRMERRKKKAKNG